MHNGFRLCEVNADSRQNCPCGSKPEVVTLHIFASMVRYSDWCKLCQIACTMQISQINSAIEEVTKIAHISNVYWSTLIRSTAPWLANGHLGYYNITQMCLPTTWPVAKFTAWISSHNLNTTASVPVSLPQWPTLFSGIFMHSERNYIVYVRHSWNGNLNSYNGRFHCGCAPFLGFSGITPSPRFGHILRWQVNKS